MSSDSTSLKPKWKVHPEKEMSLAKLRKEYHRRICKEVIRLQKEGEAEYANFSDRGNRASRAFAQGVISRIGYSPNYERIPGQAAGRLFEVITRDFLEQALALLHHLRPGAWYYSTQAPISDFDQYAHLANLERIVEQDDELAAALGKDYIITPDIVIGRWPVSDEEINQERTVLVTEDSLAQFTPLRKANSEHPRVMLHASISCKWTLRSDRGQNARTEALNLIRNRKGHLPHVVAVTAEPLPTRIASLALGTGDLDCVYHFALPELQESISEIENEDQMDMLMILIGGRRLRDISDLPFDLEQVPADVLAWHLHRRHRRRPPSPDKTEDSHMNPQIKKLGTIDCDLVETTPIVFKGSLYRFEYVRKGYWGNRTGDSYFRFVDHASGRATAPFAQGYHLGNVLVDGDTIYVTATDIWDGERVDIFATRDMKRWESWNALDLPGYGLFK